MFKDIEPSIQHIKNLLESNLPISMNEFRVSVGVFSSRLKELLITYFNYPENQVYLSPHINYYRQLQHYFVFLLRYPSILEVPHHSEILQTLLYINNQENLIKTIYEPMSQRNRDLFRGSFKDGLESLYGSFYKAEKEPN